MAQLTGQAKQEYVADLFTRISGRYDLMNDLMTGGLHRRWKKHAARVTSRGLRGTSLDVATGTADLALALARQPHIEHSVGVDLLPDMLALGRSKARARGLAGKTTLMRGDALALPFAEGSFACATAGFSLRNMPDLGRALAEMVRVVRPGGRVTTLELSPMPGGCQYRPLQLYFRRVVPLMGQLVAGNRTAYTYLPESVDRFPDAGRLAALFRELGLADVGYQRLGLGAVALHWGLKPAA